MCDNTLWTLKIWSLSVLSAGSQKGVFVNKRIIKKIISPLFLIATFALTIWYIFHDEDLGELICAHIETFLSIDRKSVV